MTLPSDLKQGDRVRVTVEAIVDGRGGFRVGSGMTEYAFYADTWAEVYGATFERLAPEPKPLERGEEVIYAGAVMHQGWYFPDTAEVVDVQGFNACIRPVGVIGWRSVPVNFLARKSGIPILTGEG